MLIGLYRLWVQHQIQHPLGVGPRLLLEGGNEGRSEPSTFRLPERLFTKPLERALVEQRRNLALDARARPLVITAVDALTLAPEKFKTDAGIYLGLRSIFWLLVRAKTDDDLRDVASRLWSLVRAKSDDDLREVAARLWSMAVGLEDGDISEAQAALRAAHEALRNALDRGADDQRLKQRWTSCARPWTASCRRCRSSSRTISSSPVRSIEMRGVLRLQDLKNLLDRLENMARNGAKDATRGLLQQLQQMMENLQMATPDMNGDDLGDMMQELDELGDMIHEQQDLRDRTFRQGQDQRRRARTARQTRAKGSSGTARSAGPARRLVWRLAAEPAGLARPPQQIARRSSATAVSGQNQQGKPGQQGQGQGDMNDLGRHERGGEQSRRGQRRQRRRLARARARCLAQGRAGSGAIDAAADRTRSRSRPQRPLGQPRAQQDTDPLGRPLRGREYGDDYTVKVPGEIDVQRARRIIEELRRRFGDVLRPQEELDYIERLLKDY